MSAVSEVSDRRSAISDQRQSAGCQPPASDHRPATHRVALLTGGSDKPYVLGITGALTAVGISVDLIGSNELSVPELLNNRSVNFLNLRGDQSSNAGLTSKVVRISRYYAKLLLYAATAKPKLFHILWNNKFELFDRTLLMVYYKLAGKRIVLTAHNVNTRKRDCRDSWLNRFSLGIQYKLADHIFVHTERMKNELLGEFDVIDCKVSVIPFGINNTAPNGNMTAVDAKERLGVNSSDKTLLCFGQIAPYKGLEYLVAAFTELLHKDSHYRLIVAGKPKWNEIYWRRIEQLILDNGVGHRVVRKIGHVPDEEIELYFKAADVLVLPYTQIFQSGVIFLGYSFGLPAIVSDVGSLREEVIEGKTGFFVRPRDSSELSRTIDHYFESDLYQNLESRRRDIKEYANQRYSWDKVTAITTGVYSRLTSRF